MSHLSRPPCVPSFHQAFQLKKTQKGSSELLTRSFCRKIGHSVNGEQKQNRAYWKNLNPMLENFCQILLCKIKYTENCRSDYSLSSQLRRNGKFLFDKNLTLYSLLSSHQPNGGFFCGNVYHSLISSLNCTLISHNYNTRMA